MKTLLEDIRTGHFSRVYLLYGEEAYLRQDYKNRLCRALDPDQDGMNFTRFSEKDIDVQEVISLCETMPFLSSRRVVLLDDSGFFKKSCDELAEYVKHLPDYLVLIFNESEIDKRGKLYKAVRDQGRVVEFGLLGADRLAQWAADFSRHEGKSLSAKDAAFLISRTGEDMGTVRMELEKLVTYVGDRKTITAADIEAVGIVRIRDRIFDMLRAVTRHDQEKALELYYDLLSLKVAPVKILVLLGREYAHLRTACSLQDAGMDRKELAEKIGVPPFSLRSVMECARMYTEKDLDAALADIVAADEAIKNGRMKDTLAVEMLIIRYCQGNKKAAG